MGREEIKAQLNKIFCRVFMDEGIQINDQMTANDIAGWDSLAHIYLVVEIEKFFKIRFNTAETASLENVGALIIAIENHLKGAAK